MGKQLKGYLQSEVGNIKFVGVCSQAVLYEIRLTMATTWCSVSYQTWLKGLPPSGRNSAFAVVDLGMCDADTQHHLS